MWSALALGAAVAVGGPFEWVAPQQCPTGGDVQSAVEDHLGMPLGDVAHESWSVLGTISGTADEGFALELLVETPDGTTERALHDPSDCAAVSDAAALLIALALDPQAVESRAEAASEAEEKPAPAPELKQTTAKPPEPEIKPAPAPKPEPPKRRTPLDFVVGAGGGFDWGTLRGVSPIGRANFAWQLPRVRVGVGAAFGVAPRFPVAGVTQEISLWMWTIAAEAGPVLKAGRFEFPLMAGLEAGQLTILPRELLAPRRQQVVWAALLLTPGVSFKPLPWLAIALRVGATVSFVRPSFAIQGIDQVIHAPAPAGIRATLGLEFRLPLLR